MKLLPVTHITSDDKRYQIRDTTNPKPAIPDPDVRSEMEYRSDSLRPKRTADSLLKKPQQENHLQMRTTDSTHEREKRRADLTSKNA